MVRRLIIALAFTLSTLHATAAFAGRCTGSPNCQECASCQNCAHCKAGGTCGVKEKAARAVPPAPVVVPAAPVNVPAPAIVADKTKQPGIATAGEGRATIYFPPLDRCAQIAVDHIGKATTEIKMQSDLLASVPIADAILAAQKRGVRIQIISNSAQQYSKYSSAALYERVGLPVMIDPSHYIHNEIIIIDGSTLLTGVFGFSADDENSVAENLLVVENKAAMIQGYLAYFDEHLKHCARFKVSADPPTTAPAR